MVNSVSSSNRFQVLRASEQALPEPIPARQPPGWSAGDSYAGPHSSEAIRLPAAATHELWSQPGLRGSETACQPAKEPYGDTSLAIRANSGGKMVLALEPLYGQDSRARWFEGSQAYALDVGKVKAANGGVMPEGKALKDFVEGHPECVLAHLSATRDPKNPNAPLGGATTFNVPPGTEVMTYAVGGQCEAMSANANEVQGSRIRQELGLGAGSPGPGAGPGAGSPSPRPIATPSFFSDPWAAMRDWFQTL